MKNYTTGGLISVLLITASTAALAEDGAFGQMAKMVTEGKVSVDFRYRFEGVDQDGFDKDAKASTLRSRLTLAGAEVNGISALLEFDNMASIGSDDYNSTTNGNSQYPIVADPKGTDLNQAWAAYNSGMFKGTFGRQRILQGSQRFVGGVGWRQNEQTYDGLRAVVKPAAGLNIDLSYIYKINRIFGPNDGAQPGKWKGGNWLLRADYTFMENHTVTGFGYALDIDEQAGYASGRTNDNSTDTYGLEYKGKIGMVSLAAAWAKQSEGDNSTLSYDADYYMVELGVGLKAMQVKAAYEVLGADNGVGFKTPLATLHKFQGWADKFLGTPGDGIEDAWFGVTGKAGPVKLGAYYHNFRAESSSAKFGSEVDLVATWPINKHFSLQAKLASFETDDASRYTDTDKFWLTAQLKL